MHTNAENNCRVGRFLCLDGIYLLHYDGSLFIRLIKFLILIIEFSFLHCGFQIICILLHILVYVALRSFFQVIEEQLKNVHVHREMNLSS